VQQPALSLPAGEVLERLQLHHVGDQGVGRELVVHADVVVLAVVHDEVEVDLREPLAESGPGAGATTGVGEVAARVDDELAAFGDGVLVQLVEAPGLLGAGAACGCGRAGRGGGRGGAERAESECGARSGGKEAPTTGKAGHWGNPFCVGAGMCPEHGRRTAPAGTAGGGNSETGVRVGHAQQAPWRRVDGIRGWDRTLTNFVPPTGKSRPGTVNSSVLISTLRSSVGNGARWGRAVHLESI
jgi:hypothetical protein